MVNEFLNYFFPNRVIKEVSEKVFACIRVIYQMLLSIGFFFDARCPEIMLKTKPFIIGIVYVFFTGCLTISFIRRINQINQNNFLKIVGHC